MRETDLVDRIRRLAGHSPLIRGIGDDCAIFRPRLNEDLVFTSDFALEDRHFTLKTHTAADIGHLALARSLSDIAAMGAEPVFCLVSLAMPRNFAVQRFFKSLLTLARKCEMTLAGGDLSRFDKVLADVICCGRVPRGKAMLRSSAKPGDLHLCHRQTRQTEPSPEATHCRRTHLTPSRRQSRHGLERWSFARPGPALP